MENLLLWFKSNFCSNLGFEFLLTDIWFNLDVG